MRKLGAESDEAFVRRTLGEMANAHNLVVINDEAHHAWRVPPKTRLKGARAKRAALAEWLRAVNTDARFDRWAEAVSFHPKDVPTLLAI